MQWAIAAAVAWILLSKGRAAAGTWPGSFRGEGEDPIPGENGLSDYWQRHPPSSIVQPIGDERLLPIRDPFGDSAGGTVRCQAIGCEGGYPDYGISPLRPILEPAPVAYFEDPIEGTPVASYLPYAGGYRILPVIAE